MVCKWRGEKRRVVPGPRAFDARRGKPSSGFVLMCGFEPRSPLPLAPPRPLASTEGGAISSERAFAGGGLCRKANTVTLLGCVFLATLHHVAAVRGVGKRKWRGRSAD